MSQEGSRPKYRKRMVTKSSYGVVQRDYDTSEFEQNKLDALQYNMLKPSKSNLNSQSQNQAASPFSGRDNSSNSRQNQNTKIVDYLQSKKQNMQYEIQSIQKDDLISQIKDADPLQRRSSTQTTSLEKFIRGEQGAFQRDSESKGHYPSQLEFSMGRGWFFEQKQPKFGRDVNWEPVQNQPSDPIINNQQVSDRASLNK